jgi:mono/diheme cytochrome c family protein
MMTRISKRWLPSSALGLLLFALTESVLAQTTGGELLLDTGEEIFLAACNGCHGPGGMGQPQATLGFEPPATFPDFTECNGSTREKMFDWRATIHEGGAVRGFSPIMPSFGEALTPAQIDKVIQYLRSRCTERAWPFGELNFPRALITEKAFPEDELVLTTSINRSGRKAVSTQLTYEKRYGARNQLELGIPLEFLKRDNGSWIGGFGDAVLGYRRVLVANNQTGSILSAQGEVIVPTGNRLRDLGSGVTVFETFAAFGQMLPRMAFLQMQSGAELPVDTEKAPRVAYWKINFGKIVAQNKGFGRAWTPMADVMAEREFTTGARTNWDVVPQLQVTLNRRQHIRANAGLRLPLNNSGDRSQQLMFYLLWDWFDGGLREGW